MTGFLPYGRSATHYPAKKPMAYNTSLFAQLLQIVPRSTFAWCDRPRPTGTASPLPPGISAWLCCICTSPRRKACARSATASDRAAASCPTSTSPRPRTPTLAHANPTRPAALYEPLFYQMLARCHATRSGKRKFKFNTPLYSLDSTTIDLCLTLFPWAAFRQTKGAVKLHLLLEHDGYRRLNVTHNAE